MWIAREHRSLGDIGFPDVRGDLRSEYYRRPGLYCGYYAARRSFPQNGIDRDGVRIGFCLWASVGLAGHSIPRTAGAGMDRSRLLCCELLSGASGPVRKLETDLRARCPPAT